MQHVLPLGTIVLAPCYPEFRRSACSIGSYLSLVERCSCIPEVGHVSVVTYYCVSFSWLFGPLQAFLLRSGYGTTQAA